MNAQGRPLSPETVQTVTRTSIITDPDGDVVMSTHTLLLGDEDNPDGDGVKAATIESYKFDPIRDPDWFLAMDGISQDLCDIGEVLLFEYERLIDALSQDARRRGADNGRFVVLDELETIPEHRGNGYGLTLLNEVIRQSLLEATFVVGYAYVVEENEDAFETRANSLALLFKERLGARVLDQRLMVIP